jgi:ribonuclease Y
LNLDPTANTIQLAALADTGAAPGWVAIAVAGGVGVGLGFLIVWVALRAQLAQARLQAAQLLEVARREGAVEAQAATQKAEEEIAARRAEANREFDRREIESELKLREIRSHEESLALLDYQLEQKGERLAREGAAIKQARDAIRALSKSVRKRLEGMASMDATEIKQALRDEVMLECQDELRALRRATLDRSEQDLQNEAKRTLIASMQRLASRPNTDLMATLVSLPSEDMKGRIIGREGRNIKAFEAATGVTLLIDESPLVVLVLCLESFRVFLCLLVLLWLV